MGATFWHIGDAFTARERAWASRAQDPWAPRSSGSRRFGLGQTLRRVSTGRSSIAGSGVGRFGTGEDGDRADLADVDERLEPLG